MSFASELQKIRTENNISQEGLAELLGVSRQSVSKWERGKGYPEIEKLIFISERFGVSLDTLLKSRDDHPSSQRRPISLEKESPEDLRISSRSDSVRISYPENSLDEEIYPENKVYASEKNTAFFGNTVVPGNSGLRAYTDSSGSSYSAGGSSGGKRSFTGQVFDRIRRRRRRLRPFARRFLLALVILSYTVGIICFILVASGYFDRTVYKTVYTESPMDGVYDGGFPDPDIPYPNLRYLYDEATGTRYIFESLYSDGIVQDVQSTDINECIKLTDPETGNTFYCENSYYYNNAAVSPAGENSHVYVIPYFMLAGVVDAENQHEYTACQDINTNTWYFVPNMILEKCEATFETETDADAGHLS